jgi:hypothetical protein
MQRLEHILRKIIPIAICELAIGLLNNYIFYACALIATVVSM